MTRRRPTDGLPPAYVPFPEYSVGELTSIQLASGDTIQVRDLRVSADNGIEAVLDSPGTVTVTQEDIQTIAIRIDQEIQGRHASMVVQTDDPEMVPITTERLREAMREFERSQPAGELSFSPLSPDCSLTDSGFYDPPSEPQSYSIAYPIQQETVRLNQRSVNYLHGLRMTRFFDISGNIIHWINYYADGSVIFHMVRGARLTAEESRALQRAMHQTWEDSRPRPQYDYRVNTEPEPEPRNADGTPATFTHYGLGRGGGNSYTMRLHRAIRSREVPGASGGHVASFPPPGPDGTLGDGSIDDLSVDQLETLNERLWVEEVYTDARPRDNLRVRTSRHGDVRMVSVLRNLQDEWNRLVPQAQARGIPRVRLLKGPLETIQYRRDKLNWLKSQLSSAVDVSALSFGVEIECIMATGVTKVMIVEAIRAVGITADIQDYNHNVSQVWKIVSDGSLGNYATGIELVSPVLYGEAGLEEVAKVADILKRFGCKITKKCGFHVHVGARDEGVDFFRSLVKLYASAEPAIDTIVAPSRRGSVNTYAQPVQVHPRVDRAQTIVEIAQAMGQSNYGIRGAARYKKLNLMSFWQHGTVEFRQHQGTVESVKIRHWVRLCLLMCAAAKKGITTVRTLDELLEIVQATESERQYFRSRVSHFNRSIPRSEAFAEAGENLSTRAVTRGQT